MGSPYNKMISAKFYVETWIKRLDTFFNKKNFSRIFSTQDIFLTRTGTVTGPERGESRPPGARPQTTPGVDLTRAQGRRGASKQSKITQKKIFSRLFRHKRSFFDTYRYRYRCRSGGASSPRHMVADRTAAGPSAGSGKQSSLQTVQNTLKNALFYQKKAITT